MALVIETFKQDIKVKLETNLQQEFTPVLKDMFEVLFQANLSGLPDNQKQMVENSQNFKDNITRWKEQFTTSFTDVLSKVLSDQLSVAIDTYIKTATVTTPAGVPVATAGTAAAQTGETTAPGIGTVS